MIKVVQLRLVAETREDAEQAIAALRESVGAARVALSSPHEGRKGGWLAYGTLQVETADNAQYAVERAAATGKTTKLPKRSI